MDAKSALSYIKSRSDVKNTKIVIYGQSLGGHLSAVVAAQMEADVDGLVIEGAFHPIMTLQQNQQESLEIEKCHICGPEYYRDSISLRILNML